MPAGGPDATERATSRSARGRFEGFGSSLMDSAGAGRRVAGKSGEHLALPRKVAQRIRLRLDTRRRDSPRARGAVRDRALGVPCTGAGPAPSTHAERSPT
jgi:hypothetical protein